MIYIQSLKHVWVNMKQESLARKNLERRLAPLRRLSFEPPPRGWLRAVRDALGMSTRQMARRLGTVPSRISALEKGEVAGSTSLKSLREAAEALDCTLVYAIVPNQPIDDLVRRRAEVLVDAELAQLTHSMRLENQAMTRRDLADERERLLEQALAAGSRRLWDEA